ncbi:MAG: AgmX/PglI C-terminal domain-containing protein [Myxococcales bacterium]|nr:AgmX/PglI C-terminal domain-containing protein [Myxococcales bacterium]
MRRWSGSAAIVAVVFGLACGPRGSAGSGGDGERPASAEGQVAVAAAAPDPAASALAVDLPAVDGSLADVPYAFEIRATGERAVFTNAPSIAAMRRDPSPDVRLLLEQLESEGLDPRIAGEADPRRSTNHLIGPLFDGIMDAVDAEKQRAINLGRSPNLTAALAVDEATPMSAVVDLLYTSGRGELERFAAAVTTAAGVGHIPFAPLVSGCAPSEAAVKCVTPAIFVARDGVFVSVMAGPEPYICNGVSRRRAARVLLEGAGGGCASVRRESGVAGVEALLREIKAQAELCETTVVGAEPGERWGDLVPHMVSAHRRGAVLIAAEPQVPLHCDDARPVAAVGEWFAAPREPADPGPSSPEPAEPADPFAGLTEHTVAVVDADDAKRASTDLDITVTVAGAHAMDDVLRITRAHRGELRFCHEKTGAAARGRVGTQVTRYRVAADGTIGDVVTESDELGEPSFAACVKKAVSRWKYPSVGESDVSLRLSVGRGR